MPSNTSKKESIQEIFDLFTQAEKKISQYNLYTGKGLCIHPINQLRYAAHHILRALIATSDSDIQVHHIKAKDHCERAIYDALDHTIIVELDTISDFQERMKWMIITDIAPNYIKDLTYCEEIKSKLSENKREIENSSYNYQQLQEYLDVIHKFKLSLPTIEQQINAKIRIQNRKDLLIIIGIIIALFAAITPFLLK